MRLLMLGAPFVPRAIPYAVCQLWLRGYKIGGVNVKKKPQKTVFCFWKEWVLICYIFYVSFNYLLSRVIDLKIEQF